MKTYIFSLIAMCVLVFLGIITLIMGVFNSDIGLGIAGTFIIMFGSSAIGILWSKGIKIREESK